MMYVLYFILAVLALNIIFVAYMYIKIKLEDYNLDREPDGYYDQEQYKAVDR